VDRGCYSSQDPIGPCLGGQPSSGRKATAEYRAAIQQLLNNNRTRTSSAHCRTGPELAPRLLSELGSDRSVFESAQSLQCLAGRPP